MNSDIAKEWPWRFNLLDIPTSAALAGITAGLLLTRAQFAMSLRPDIGWSGHDEKSRYLTNAAWTVHLQNHGPGRCRIKKIEYSYALIGKLSSNWKTWDMLVDELAELGILVGRDYHLENNSVGRTIPVTSERTLETELAAFTRECLTRLSSLDMAVEVEDIIGDAYTRTIEILRAAHRTIELKTADVTKTNRFRRKSQ